MRRRSKWSQGKGTQAKRRGFSLKRSASCLAHKQTRCSLRVNWRRHPGTCLSCWVDIKMPNMPLRESLFWISSFSSALQVLWTRVFQYFSPSFNILPCSTHIRMSKKDSTQITMFKDSSSDQGNVFQVLRAFTWERGDVLTTTRMENTWRVSWRRSDTK